MKWRCSRGGQIRCGKLTLWPVATPFSWIAGTSGLIVLADIAYLANRELTEGEFTGLCRSRNYIQGVRTWKSSTLGGGVFVLSESNRDGMRGYNYGTPMTVMRDTNVGALICIPRENLAEIRWQPFEEEKHDSREILL